MKKPLSYSQLNRQHGALNRQFIRAIEKKVKEILKGNHDKMIVPKSDLPVWYHLITDDNYAKLNSIYLLDKNTVIFNVAETIKSIGFVNNFNEGTDEMQTPSMNEVLLFLNEGQYTLQPLGEDEKEYIKTVNVE